MTDPLLTRKKLHQVPSNFQQMSAKTEFSGQNRQLSRLSLNTNKKRKKKRTVIVFFAKQFFRFPCIILDGLRLHLQSGQTDSRTGVPLYGNDRTKFDRMHKPMVNLTGGWHTLSDPPHHRWEVSDIPVSLFVCMLWWGLDPPPSPPTYTYTLAPYTRDHPVISLKNFLTSKRIWKCYLCPNMSNLSHPLLLQ